MPLIQWIMQNLGVPKPKGIVNFTVESHFLADAKVIHQSACLTISGMTITGLIPAIPINCILTGSVNANLELIRVY